LAPVVIPANRDELLARLRARNPENLVLSGVNARRR
jgi:hypothetical protein